MRTVPTTRIIRPGSQRRLLAGILGTLALSILACPDASGPSAFSRFEQVRVGMPLDQVEQLLGPPAYAEAVSANGLGGNCPESATRVLLFHSPDSRDLSLLICTAPANIVVSRNYQTISAY